MTQGVAYHHYGKREAEAAPDFEEEAPEDWKDCEGEGEDQLAAQEEGYGEMATWENHENVLLDHEGQLQQLTAYIEVLERRLATNESRMATMEKALERMAAMEKTLEKREKMAPLTRMAPPEEMAPPEDEEENGEWVTLTPGSTKAPSTFTGEVFKVGFLDDAPAMERFLERLGDYLQDNAHCSPGRLAAALIASCPDDASKVMLREATKGKEWTHEQLHNTLKGKMTKGAKQAVREDFSKMRLGRGESLKVHIIRWRARLQKLRQAGTVTWDPEETLERFKTSLGEHAVIKEAGRASLYHELEDLESYLDFCQRYAEEPSLNNQNRRVAAIEEEEGGMEKRGDEPLINAEIGRAHV